MRLTGSAITVPGATSITTPSCMKAAFKETMESCAARSCEDNSAIRSDRPSVNTEASERTFSPAGKRPDNSGTKKPSTKTRRRAGAPAAVNSLRNASMVAAAGTVASGKASRTSVRRSV
jgi:hypothetical protein